MNIFTLIFGDRRLEGYGRALLEFFDQADFPKEILKYPELNLIYCRAKYDKSHDECSQETADYLAAMLAMRRKRLDAEPEESDQ